MSGRSPLLQLQVELPCRARRLDSTAEALSRQTVFVLALQLGHVNLGGRVRIGRMTATGGGPDAFDEAMKMWSRRTTLLSDLGYVNMMGALRHHD